MKRICLFLSIILLFISLSGVTYIKTYALANPTIKIGLFYKTTAQSQISISADKGVSFNAFDAINNKYYPVYDSGVGEVITIRKDSYFTSSGLKCTPVAATSNPTIGPFHIQIQDTFTTYNDTLPIVQGYIQKGVAAYPVYTDSGWNVWAGFYINKAAAEAAVVDVKAKLGENTYKVIEQVDTRIYGVNSSEEVKFMYAAAKNLLRGKSLSTDNPNPIKIGTGKLNTFRGQVEFFRKSDSDMTIINVLPFEEYLYGVVPNEIESYSHVEALKVQAISSRSFLYKTLNKHAAYGFNLCSTTDCQVYRGKDSESTITNNTIDATKDMVVTYNGEIAETLFSASSGGQTEDAINVWNYNVPYLKSVEDKYESGISNNYNWNESFTIDEISEKLKGKNIGTVTGIEITKYSDAGRAIELIVRGTLKPEGVLITKYNCKTFLNLPSQWYTITTNANINVSINSQKVSTQLGQLNVITATGQTTYSDPDQQVTILGANGASTTVSVSPTEYNFVGKGWGHGLGMSQEGAKGMANAGFTYDQILAHYYTGTKIELKK
jgi:stage II sporulation protein D